MRHTLADLSFLQLPQMVVENGAIRRGGFVVFFFWVLLPAYIWKTVLVLPIILCGKLNYANFYKMYTLQIDLCIAGGFVLSNSYFFNG